MQPTPLTIFLFSLQSVALPALSLGYASTIVLLWQNPVWQRRLMPFGTSGEWRSPMNYLLQSLICTTIFYSYGFGLYGRVGPLAGFFIGIVIYGLQIPFSMWWLSTHRYGPMEWVWRRLTYGSVQPAVVTDSLLCNFLLGVFPHQLLEVVGGLGILRNDLQRLLRVAQRFVAIAKGEVRVRQAVVGVRRRRVGVDVQLEYFDRVLRIPALEKLISVMVGFVLRD